MEFAVRGEPTRPPRSLGGMAIWGGKPLSLKCSLSAAGSKTRLSFLNAWATPTEAMSGNMGNPSPSVLQPDALGTRPYAGAYISTIPTQTHDQNQRPFILISFPTPCFPLCPKTLALEKGFSTLHDCHREPECLLQRAGAHCRVASRLPGPWPLPPSRHNPNCPWTFPNTPSPPRQRNYP